MEVLDSFRCPLSREVFEDPVILVANKKAYERSWIEDWFRRGHRKDPITGAELADISLVEAEALKVAIEEFMGKNEAIAKEQEALKARLLHAEVGNPAVVNMRFFDKTSMKIMRRPVKAADGYTYDQANLDMHFRHCRLEGDVVRSPITGEEMSDVYEADEGLRKEIDDFLQTLSPIAKPPAPSELGLGSVVDLRPMFSALDELQDYLVQTLGNWKAPRLVVFGGEKVGKSTVLQRLCGLPLFPSDVKRCTKMPVSVEVRRSRMQSVPTLQVWDVKGGRPVGKVVQIPLIVGTKEVKAKMEAVMKEHCPEGEVSMGHELRITVSSTTLPPMNFLDLPGLMRHPKELGEQTQELASRYIQESPTTDLFLAVAKVSDEPSDWASAVLVATHKIETRTIGVLTKCDLLAIQPERVGEVLQWLSPDYAEAGFQKLKPHGYVAVASKPIPATEGPMDEMQRDAALRQSRQEVEAFRDLEMSKQVEGKRAGIHALMARISEVYRDHVIKTWVPASLDRLLEGWSAECVALEELGLPRSSGDLRGQPLQRLHHAAREDCRKRLRFSVERAGQLFAEHVIKPLDALLRQHLESLEKSDIHIVELSRVLEGVIGQIESDLRIAAPGFQTQWLDEAMAALEEDSRPFRLGVRFPDLKRFLQERLSDNMPKIEERKAKSKLLNYLRAALDASSSSGLLELVPTSSLELVRLKLKTEHIIRGCFYMVSQEYKALKHERDVDEAIVEVALKKVFPEADRQEVEVSHGARKRIYRRMEQIGTAVTKLVDMQCRETGQDRDSALRSMLLESPLGLDPASHEVDGDDPKSDDFLAEECRWLKGALSTAPLAGSGHRRILMLGCKGSGKTTLLHLLMHGTFDPTKPPTVRCNSERFEYGSTIFHIYDVGGQDRDHWKRYYRMTQALIFVVELVQATAPQQRQALEEVLAELKGVKVGLVFNVPYSNRLYGSNGMRNGKEGSYASAGRQWLTTDRLLSGRSYGAYAVSPQEEVSHAVGRMRSCLQWLASD